MRRAGQNPTDVEVQDLINKIDDGSGTLDFTDFCLVIKEKTKELYNELEKWRKIKEAPVPVKKNPNYNQKYVDSILLKKGVFN